MKSQKQVAVELIQQHVQAYQAKDIHDVYGERLTKAESLLLEEKVMRIKEGVYHVQGTREEPYLVNGQCECIDFVGGKAPNGWCKHRIAAKLYHKTLEGLLAMKAEGIPHLHLACQHKNVLEMCWQGGCQEPMDQLCEMCLGAMELAAEESAVQAEEVACQAHDFCMDGPPLNGEGALPAGKRLLSVEELSALAQPPYEACPEGPPCKSKRPPRSSAAMPMPEAPASVNLQLKVGGVQVMYTARSMKRGSAGDQELAERLPTIIAMLESMNVETEQQPVGLFQRLVRLCRIKGTAEQERWS